MKLRDLYENIQSEILNELLDCENIGDYKFETINDFEFRFKTIDESIVYIKFEEFIGDEIDQYFRFPETFSPKLKVVYNTAFSVDEFETQAKVTDLRYTLPIFKTITNINKRFISKHNPDCITVFATSRTGSGIDSTKLKIWKLNAMKHKPSNYNIDKCFQKPGNEPGFCLYKNELLKRGNKK